MSQDTHARLRELADLLRHPEQWPTNFKWDFRRQCSCAIGLAKDANIIIDMYYLDLDYEDRRAIFLAGSDGFFARFIGPRTIARRIDKMLARG